MGDASWSAIFRCIITPHVIVGTGSSFAINQHPYTLSVRSKAQLASDGDSAGLEVLAPYTEIIMNSDGATSGVRQSLSDRQIGVFIGVKLGDLGDFVVRHVVESYGPLEVVKRWDLSTYRRDKNGAALVEEPKINSVNMKS